MNTRDGYARIVGAVLLVAVVLFAVAPGWAARTSSEDDQEGVAATTTGAWQLMDALPWPAVTLPLLIFCARIADVSIGTVRLICVTRGMNVLAVGLGFFEVLIWVSAVSTVLVHLDNWVNILAYAGGFTTGSAVGLWIEQRLALGVVAVTFISRQFGAEIAGQLRAANARVTTITGSGRDGPVEVSLAVVPRRQTAPLVAVARVVDPEVVVTVQDVRHTTSKPGALVFPGKAPVGFKLMAEHA